MKNRIEKSALKRQKNILGGIEKMKILNEGLYQKFKLGREKEIAMGWMLQEMGGLPPSRRVAGIPTRQFGFELNSRGGQLSFNVSPPGRGPYGLTNAGIP